MNVSPPARQRGQGRRQDSVSVYSDPDSFRQDAAKICSCAVHLRAALDIPGLSPSKIRWSKGIGLIRLLCAALAVSLLGSSAAFGRSGVPSARSPSHEELSDTEPASPGIHKLADLAVKSLSAIDGSTLTLAPAQGGWRARLSCPTAELKKPALCF